MRCNCPSKLLHSITCELTHPELAALPTEMPPGISVKTPWRGLVTVSLPEGIFGAKPAQARGLARMLLLKADEAERSAEATDA